MPPGSSHVQVCLFVGIGMLSHGFRTASKLTNGVLDDMLQYAPVYSRAQVLLLPWECSVFRFNQLFASRL